MIFISTTNVGFSRKENQDFLGHLEINKGHLFIVCDGVGGLPNGKLASKTAVNCILKMFSRAFEDPLKYLQQALDAAHIAIKDADPNFLGTTAVAVYIEDDKIFSAWCGDSRIYHFRDNALKWMSRDHNVLHDVLNCGKGRGSLYLNSQAITRYLGKEDNHGVDIHEFTKNPGDKILLCSDGLSNFILEPDIVNTITKNDCKNASKILEEKLLSKEVGAPDNFTWYMIEV